MLQRDQQRRKRNRALPQDVHAREIGAVGDAEEPDLRVVVRRRRTIVSPLRCASASSRLPAANDVPIFRNGPRYSRRRSIADHRSTDARR